MALSGLGVIQNSSGVCWGFCGENSEIVDFESGEYGRLLLQGVSNPDLCLQPSSMFPCDGWQINLCPVQIGNDSQFWRFVSQDEEGFFLIENKLERKKNKGLSIFKMCIDVCEEKNHDQALVITYHMKNRGQSNQRWEVVKA